MFSLCVFCWNTSSVECNSPFKRFALQPPGRGKEGVGASNTDWKPSSRRYYSEQWEKYFVKNCDKEKKTDDNRFLFHFMSQLAKFRKLKAHYGKHPGRMCDNYRPIQPRKGRKVYFVTRND